MLSLVLMPSKTHLYTIDAQMRDNRVLREIRFNGCTSAWASAGVCACTNVCNNLRMENISTPIDAKYTITYIRRTRRSRGMRSRAHASHIKDATDIINAMRVDPHSLQAHQWSCEAPETTQQLPGACTALRLLLLLMRYFCCECVVTVCCIWVCISLTINYYYGLFCVYKM